MRRIHRIIVHCSDSIFGDLEQIDAWHKERGWNGCGYHYLILSGVVNSYSRYDPAFDGLIESGRPDEEQGAHALGENEDSLGIVLIGRHHFTQTQLFVSLPYILIEKMKQYNISVKDVYGHGELTKDRTCPNIDMQKYREFLNICLRYGEGSP